MIDRREPTVDWGFSGYEIGLPESASFTQRMRRLVYSVTRARRMAEARKKGTHTNGEWLALVKHFGGRCLRCGCTDRPMTKDHVVSVYSGGSDGIENLQPLCAPCNTSKWMGSRDYRPDVSRGTLT